MEEIIEKVEAHSIENDVNATAFDESELFDDLDD